MSERPPAPDQAARDLIRERPDVTLLVEAGAGSGKTECLAQRMAMGVLEGRYQVQQMAAVTFTRKAAAELRARFQLTLESALAAESDPVRRERALHALRHLERLCAGPIHAFCAHLLRERPVEAGVAPGFSELDEVAEVDQRRWAGRDYLDRQRGEGAAALRELLDAGVRPVDLDRAFEKVCNYPEVAFPAGDAPRPAPARARAALEGFWAALTALLPDGGPREATCSVQRRMREFTRRLRVASLDDPRVVAELAAEWEGEPRVVQKWWPRGKTDKERVEALFNALPRDTLPFRAALQEKYRWLFVDEFQDTDPIQAEVILLLAGAPSTERDWTRVPLQPGALFVVGDPKQSIYRFRRADIDIYQAVRQRIEATGGQVATLTSCFRSVPALCDWINRAFGQLFPTEPTPHQPGFAGLQAARAEREPAFGVRTIEIPDAVAGGDAAARFDAEVIARFIRAQVDARRRAPGDFLVLTRTRRALPIYTRAIEAFRLPVEVSGGAAFAQSTAVTALADLLRALTDPDDGPAVVGVLRGPLFGLSDPELFRHRQAGFGFLVPAPNLAEMSGPVGEALRAMPRMYEWTRRLPAPAAVERVLEATGLLAPTAAGSPGGAEAGDLLHAVDRIRQVTEEGGTLADAAEALIEDLSSAEVESVPLEPGRTNVVRVMNLHN